MRPLELKLRNFRSYFGEGASFDFRGRRLVGVVGPIGSGKSSLLDAIAFALYGRTPTVAANTKSLIHQRADEATVSLRFEVEGEIWEAVRMLRRSGASQHALYRYEGDNAEDPVEKLQLEGEVNGRVAELLGLEFDAFGRSVMLAQGRFAEFLRARPAERDRVLKGVFGHDRIDAMRAAARDRGAAAAVEVEKLSVRLERFDQAAAEAAELREQLDETQLRVKQLEAAAGEVRDLQARSAAAEAERRAAEDRLASLADVRSRFPERDVAGRVIEAASAAGGQRRERATALEAARQALASADGAVAAVRAAGEQQVLEEAAALVGKLEPLRAAAAQAAQRHERAVAKREARAGAVEESAAQVTASASAVEEAHAALGAAGAALAATQAALHDAQHADMAAELRAGLEPGAPCPVCAQTVAELPPPVAAPLLAEARAAHEAAATAAEEAATVRRRSGEGHAAAVRSHEEAVAALAGAEDDVRAAAADADTARAAVDAAGADLAGLVGPGDAVELLAERRASYDRVLADAAKAREMADRARHEHDRAIRDEQEAGKALSALRVDLADVGARIGVAAGAAEAGPEGVASHLEALEEAWKAAHERATEAKRDTAEEGRAVARRLAELMKDLAVEGEFAAALASASAREELLRAEIARRDAEVAAGSDVAAGRDAAAATRATYERIASDLTDARFVRYLLDDERARLAALGSDHFLALSAGRYLFTEDGKFDVVDQTSAGAVRKAESLSGGETFLAALALALALAEMVARTGGRLDAFFLDEGFGSLDPEHLDLAMDGVEALVTGVEHRLVVAVSHVPELRERFEDLIILDRDPVTGDTRVVRS